MRSEGNAPKNREQQLVPRSRQCSSTLVDFCQGFLSKEQCDNTGASPYSADLAPDDFYPFHRLKLALKGRRFCDVTDIIKNATEELERLSQNDFQECFQHLIKFVVAQGDSLKEMKLTCLYCFVFLRNKVIPGTFWSYHVRTYIHTDIYYTHKLTCIHILLKIFRKWVVADLVPLRCVYSTYRVSHMQYMMHAWPILFPHEREKKIWALARPLLLIQGVNYVGRPTYSYSISLTLSGKMPQNQPIKKD